MPIATDEHNNNLLSRMFSQLYTINRMHDTTHPPVRHSHEVEKKENDVAHLERVTTHTPPSEVEKGQPLAPVTSRGPVVHEKVGVSE
jgi:hypothetical protein